MFISTFWQDFASRSSSCQYLVITIYNIIQYLTCDLQSAQSHRTVYIGTVIICIWVSRAICETPNWSAPLYHPRSPLLISACTTWDLALGIRLTGLPTPTIIAFKIQHYVSSLWCFQMNAQNCSVYNTRYCIPILSMCMYVYQTAAYRPLLIRGI